MFCGHALNAADDLDVKAWYLQHAQAPCQIVRFRAGGASTIKLVKRLLVSTGCVRVETQNEITS